MPQFRSVGNFLFLSALFLTLVGMDKNFSLNAAK